MTNYQELINQPIIDKLKLRIPNTLTNQAIINDLQNDYPIYWNYSHYAGYLYIATDQTKQGVLGYNSSDFDKAYYLTFNPAKLSEQAKNDLKRILSRLQGLSLTKIDLAFDCRFDLVNDTYIYNHRIKTVGQFQSNASTRYIGKTNASNRALTIYDKNAERKNNNYEICHRLEIHLNKQYARDFLSLDSKAILNGFSIKKLNLNQPIKRYNKETYLSYMEKVAIYDYLTNSSGLKSFATDKEKKAIDRLIKKCNQVDLQPYFTAKLDQNLHKLQSEISTYLNNNITIYKGVV